jgi:hypothetical protein
VPTVRLSRGSVRSYIAIGLDGLHERLGNSHGDVEVVQLGIGGLAKDKLHDIRVVDPQDRHIGAAPGAALLDLFRGRVENLHEGNGAGGNAAGGAHHGILRPQPGKGETGATARFMNDGGIFQ